MARRHCSRLNVLDGTVIGRNMQRTGTRSSSASSHHRGAGAGAKAIHAIVDNYATHKHPKVRQWLARHPRWTFHFMPHRILAQRRRGFFAKLTKQRLERGIFLSVVDLQAAIIASSSNITPNRNPSHGLPILTNYPSRQTRAPSVRFHPLAEAEAVLKRCETAYSAATSVGLAAAFQNDPHLLPTRCGCGSSA